MSQPGFDAVLVPWLSGREKKTVCHGKTAALPADLVERRFVADRPDQLWLADITYCSTWEGWLYVSSITDVYSRAIIGWQIADHLRTDLVLDALEMAVWRRNIAPDSLIRHGDRGCQYTSFRYGDRLADAGISALVGSRRDCDNAMAEALNGTFEAEVVHLHGPWRTRAQLEVAIINWVHWYNQSRRRGRRHPTDRARSGFVSSAQRRRPRGVTPPTRTGRDPGGSDQPDGGARYGAFRRVLGRTVSPHRLVVVLVGIAGIAPACGGSPANRHPQGLASATSTPDGPPGTPAVVTPPPGVTMPPPSPTIPAPREPSGGATRYAPTPSDAAAIGSAYARFTGFTGCQVQPIAAGLVAGMVVSTGVVWAFGPMKTATGCTVDQGNARVDPMTGYPFGSTPENTGVFEKVSGRWQMNWFESRPFPCPANTNYPRLTPGPGSPTVPLAVLNAVGLPYASQSCDRIYLPPAPPDGNPP